MGHRRSRSETEAAAMAYLTAQDAESPHTKRGMDSWNTARHLGVTQGYAASVLRALTMRGHLARRTVSATYFYRTTGKPL